MGVAVLAGAPLLAWLGQAAGWAVGATGLLALLAGASVWAAGRHRPGPAPAMPAALSPARPSDERALWLTLFEGCGEALLWCDRHGRLRAANPAALKLLARPSDSLLGQALPWSSPAPGANQPVHTEWKRPDGSRLAIEAHWLPVAGPRDAGGLWRIHDLSARQEAEREVSKLANYDNLTGLPNRALFRDRLQQAMLRARRNNRPMALMFLDLDRFKLVNDSLGHAAGDRLLRHVAQTLSGCLRTVDTVGQCSLGGATVSRLGGDEFTVIVEEVGGSDDAALIARRMLDALAVPFACGQEEIVVSASIGISMYPTDDVDLDGLLRHTDMAMYRSKSLGRNTFCFFSDDLDTDVQARLSLEGSLRRAVEHREFALHYQPKVCLITGVVTGVEALLRWNCPGKGMVPPDRFVPVLEDTGLILPVGAWVIQQALAELEAWDRQGLPPITLAVNLSVRQLRQQFLTSVVEDNLRQRAIAPARLELELTESLLMEDTEVTRTMLSSLERLGIRLAIDDFGTGHSSLSYLRRFKVDTLKIDRSFVSETPGDPEACAVASAVVALGRSLDMKLVAEGVETVEQAEFLRGLGCHDAQGYLISRPRPLPELMDWFRDYDAQRRRGRAPIFAPRHWRDDALIDIEQREAERQDAAV